MTTNPTTAASFLPPFLQAAVLQQTANIKQESSPPPVSEMPTATANIFQQWLQAQLLAHAQHNVANVTQGTPFSMDTILSRPRGNDGQTPPTAKRVCLEGESLFISQKFDVDMLFA